MPTTQDRFRGALLGLAVGDAVGTTVEFRNPGTFDEVTDMVGGGPFNLPAGVWTDDTSMALCLAESLIDRQGFDPIDQLSRYVRWWRDGHLSSTGDCFDIGGATSTALGHFERTGDAFPGQTFPNAGGNGTLMRLAPVPMAFAHDPAQAVELSKSSALTTHGQLATVDATRYFGGLIAGALNGASRDELIGAGPYEPLPGIWADSSLHPEVVGVAAGSFRENEPPTINGDGYSVTSMEAALWAINEGGSFRDMILRVVNLGRDADTTAAIAGQLAGAMLGAAAIPAEWLDKLVMREKITDFADKLHALSETLS